MVESSAPDAREQALRAWLTDALGHADFSLAPVGSDASFRRYFRVQANGRSYVAMDAPPPQEDCTPFVAVAGLLAGAGVHVPAIHAQDLGHGFLLLDDLGDRSYIDTLTAANADALFADAIDALITWQRASRPGVLPDYDAATLETELRLFDQWYLARHLGVQLAAQERETLDTAYAQIVARALAQPRVFVHRDYMPRNLMVSTPNPGVLDFQDARYGPLSYDLLSLFKDAFISWPQARIDDWCARYRRQAKAAGLPVPEDDRALARDLDWMGVQRHLKVLGIFARIRHRDGKPRYLADAARFVSYLQDELSRLPELADFAQLFDRHVVNA